MEGFARARGRCGDGMRVRARNWDQRRERLGLSVKMVDG